MSSYNPALTPEMTLRALRFALLLFKSVFINRKISPVWSHLSICVLVLNLPVYVIGHFQVKFYWLVLFDRVI